MTARASSAGASRGRAGPRGSRRAASRRASERPARRAGAAAGVCARTENDSPSKQDNRITSRAMQVPVPWESGILGMSGEERQACSRNRPGGRNRRLASRGTWDDHELRAPYVAGFLRLRIESRSSRTIFRCAGDVALPTRHVDFPHSFLSVSGSFQDNFRPIARRHKRHAVITYVNGG